MKTLSLLAAAIVCCLLGGPAVATSHAPHHSASGQVVVVQAVPGATVSVAVDGRSTRRAAPVGTVLTPVTLAAGPHRLTFTLSSGKRIATTVDVPAGTRNDVVLHLPASPTGAPVVNSYRTPLTPIGPDKARVLLAHTATVAPADVSFDGKVVFTQIANGEFAEADVPAGAHRVSLLPSGERRHPFFGPVSVTLPPLTVTMVFAIGDPTNGSMSAITDRVTLTADGSQAPRAIDTGSGGFAAMFRVHPFGR